MINKDKARKKELAISKAGFLVLFIPPAQCSATDLTRALEGGGGRFCPPLMLFGDIKKTYRLILTSFLVPDQK